MSKPWFPRPHEGARPARRRSRLPRERQPYRRRRRQRLRLRDLQLAVLGGVALGLLAAAASTFGPMSPVPRAAPSVPVEAPDPWRESRRSQELLGPQEAAPRALPGTAGAANAAGAVRVIDGDTFHFAGEKIRIADIDTPEVQGRCPYESALAAQATQRLEALLAEGPFELVPADRDEDPYGRKLRIVTRGGDSLGDVLIAEGLARPWEGRRRSWCA